MVLPRILHDRYSEHIEDETPFLDSSKASMPYTWQAAGRLRKRPLRPFATSNELDPNSSEYDF